MKHTRTRDFLSRSSRDMRNPYGSRGGYVMNGRRDRNYDYYAGNGSMDYARQPRSSNGDRYYPMYDYAMGSNYSQSNRQSYGRDANYDMNYYPVRRMGYFDYNTYGSDYDMRGGRDYGENEYKLNPSEMRKWEHELKNADGSHGAKFDVNQVQQIAQQLGIRFNEFSPELLTTMTNVMYSDYSNAIKTDVAGYVKMAEAFLCDDDFDGTPDEKAYLYYTAIVNKDDD